MIAKATLRYVRISPRKVRQVIPLIKGKRAEDAVAVLFSVKKRASEYLIDLIESAMANARRMQGVDVANLYVSNLIANGGPQLKRFRAASMGRAGMIRKRTSHITVELDTLAGKETPAGKAAGTQGAEQKKTGQRRAAKTKAAESAKQAKKPRAKEAPKADSGKKNKE